MLSILHSTEDCCAVKNSITIRTMRQSVEAAFGEANGDGNR